MGARAEARSSVRRGEHYITHYTSLSAWPCPACDGTRGLRHHNVSGLRGPPECPFQSPSHSLGSGAPGTRTVKAIRTGKVMRTVKTRLTLHSCNGITLFRVAGSLPPFLSPSLTPPPCLLVGVLLVHGVSYEQFFLLHHHHLLLPPSSSAPPSSLLPTVFRDATILILPFEFHWGMETQSHITSYLESHQTFLRAEVGLARVHHLVHHQTWSYKQANRKA